MDDELTRRRLLALGVVVPLGLLGCGDDGGSASAALAKTPSCDDGDETPEQTEGPYFTPGSPRRRNLRAGGLDGRALLVTGRVLSPDCRPRRRALLDFWQADGAGEYDNSGFGGRGHQFTDAEGRFRLVTVVPGLYVGVLGLRRRYSRAGKGHAGHQCHRSGDPVGRSPHPTS